MFPGSNEKEVDMQAALEDRPEVDLNGRQLRNIVNVLLERRATSHFLPDPVPDEDLHDILRLAGQAPSGYNFQPWRFIVVRDEINRKRLRKVAFDQEKVSEAPVVVIAVGMKEETKRLAGDILMEGAKRGAGRIENVEPIKNQALSFLSTIRMDLWVNRHTMIAFTTMMLVAEAYGYDTAPMEGFDPAGVKREFGIPEEGEVVALLAIGKVREPDRVYPGRLPLEQIAFGEKFGQPLE
jgi:nitroreductase